MFFAFPRLSDFLLYGVPFLPKVQNYLNLKNVSGFSKCHWYLVNITCIYKISLVFTKYHWYLAISLVFSKYHWYLVHIATCIYMYVEVDGFKEGCDDILMVVGVLLFVVVLFSLAKYQ